MTILQAILIAFIIIIIAVIVIAVSLNNEMTRKKRIMLAVQGEDYYRNTKGRALDDRHKQHEGLARKLKESKGEEGAQNKKKIPISQMIAQAGLNISVKKFWMASVLSMLLFAVIAKLFGYSIFVTLMFAVIGLLGVPKLILKWLAKRRQKQFLEEFPDALEATVRLLKAGMPVSEAVLMISKEFSGPVGEEMSRIYDQQKIGVALHEAALEATKRIPLSEMQMFATGLAIQAQTGSSLSEVLTNLSNVIRSRFRLKRKIKALSSEAVASASIIGALPLLVAGGMYFVNTEYIMLLFETLTGKLLISGAGFWMLVGIAAMKIMINFKV